MKTIDKDNNELTLERKLLLRFQKYTEILLTIIKCTVFGAWIILKSIISTILPTPTKDIQNQVALVTGGARDIGRWISIELAKYGCHIAVADIDIDGAKDCCEELHMLGVKAFPYKCDVSNLDEVRTLRERIRKDLGNVDILVNSAAISSKETLIDVPPGEIVRMFKVNLLSQIWAIRVFLPEMIANARGHIVSVASLMAIDSSGNDICYSATKFGTRGLMDGLAELIRIDRLPINVTTVYPPVVRAKKDFIEEYMEQEELTRDPTKIKPETSKKTFFTPKDIGFAAVDAIIKNEKIVSIPFAFSTVFNIFTLLPDDFQQLIRDNFKSNVHIGINKSKVQ